MTEGSRYVCVRQYDCDRSSIYYLLSCCQQTAKRDLLLSPTFVYLIGREKVTF